MESYVNMEQAPRHSHTEKGIEETMDKACQLRQENTLFMINWIQLNLKPQQEQYSPTTTRPTLPINNNKDPERRKQDETLLQENIYGS